MALLSLLQVPFSQMNLDKPHGFLALICESSLLVCDLLTTARAPRGTQGTPISTHFLEADKAAGIWRN